MSKSKELFKEALEQMKKHNAKLGANEVIQQAIDFGMERETPLLWMQLLKF